MGIIRKTMSVGTLGAIDFRSDKERTARYTRQTRNAVRAQSSMQANLTAQQLVAHQLAAQQQQQHGPQGPPPGWYVSPTDPPTLLRWWDGQIWSPHTRPR